MKCALPGRYGKKVTIESSAILDSYYENDIDREKKLSEDVGLSFNDMYNQFETMIDQYIKSIEEDFYISDLKKNKLNERGCGKTQFQDQMFKEYMEQLLQKDKKEHEK